MSYLIRPKVGEVWREQTNPLEFVTILKTYSGCDYCDINHNGVLYGRGAESAISITTLNEFYTAPLNAKLDFLLEEKDGS